MIFSSSINRTASFLASPIYYGFSGEYYIKSQTFSKKLYHTSPEIACSSFCRFAGGSPAFLAVWGGQTERETPLADFKLHAARVRVCVGLAALVRVLSGVGGKLPNVAALQAEYVILKSSKTL